MEDSHASVPGGMHLDGDVSGQVCLDFGFLGRVDSWIESSSRVVEAFVSDFIGHLGSVIYINYNFKIKSIII